MKTTQESFHLLREVFNFTRKALKNSNYKKMKSTNST